MTTVVEITPIRIAHDARHGLLIEATKFDREGATLSDIRMMEALRYTDVMISHFDLDGNLIALNASAAVSSPLSMYHCDVRFPVPVVACLEPDADGYDCIV